MSRKLITTSGIVGLLMGYLYFGEGMNWALIPTISLGIIFMLSWVFQYQIDIWWTRRNAPDVDDEMRGLLSAHSAFYAALSKEDREIFDWRMGVFVVTKEFIPQGLKKIPDDAKFICAFYATWLTWYRGDHLMSPFDRVVFYIHPFMTPNYPDQVHIYEVEQVDGTTILSLNHFMLGFKEPQNYYSTGLHCALEIYLSLNGTPDFDLPGDIWSRLESISTINREKLEAYTGMAQEDPWPVVLYHALVYPEKFALSESSVYRGVTDYLGVTNTEQKPVE